MQTKTKAFFIAIEGIDAVGKRTQSSLLAAWLMSRGVTVSSLSFPDYGTEIGREIRRFFDGGKNYPPEAIHMLLAANRWENKEHIESALLKGDVLIVNRYSASNLAYGISNGLKLDWLMGLEEGLPVPDLICVLDAAPDTISSRRKLNKDRYERNVSLQEKVRSAYLVLAKEFGWRVVRADQTIESTNTDLRKSVPDSLFTKSRTV